MAASATFGGCGLPNLSVFEGVEQQTAGIPVQQTPHGSLSEFVSPVIVGSNLLPLNIEVVADEPRSIEAEG